MKKTLGIVIAAILAKKAGCGCLVIIWALLSLLVVVLTGIISTALGIPWESVRWLPRLMLTIEVLLIVCSFFL
jgi:hypothetical protein